LKVQLPLMENRRNGTLNSFGRYRSCVATGLLKAGMTPRQVILYSRRGCHLCDDALAVLQRYGLTPQVTDIDADPQLLARYDTCVPVVEIDGQERFRGQVNEVLLRRLLATEKL
jgi:glutaredoxin